MVFIEKFCGRWYDNDFGCCDFHIAWYSLAHVLPHLTRTHARPRSLHDVKLGAMTRRDKFWQIFTRPLGAPCVRGQSRDPNTTSNQHHKSL